MLDSLGHAGIVSLLRACRSNDNQSSKYIAESDPIFLGVIRTSCILRRKTFFGSKRCKRRRSKGNVFVTPDSPKGDRATRPRGQSHSGPPITHQPRCDSHHKSLSLARNSAMEYCRSVLLRWMLVRQHLLGAQKARRPVNHSVQ